MSIHMYRIFHKAYLYACTYLIEFSNYMHIQMRPSRLTDFYEFVIKTKTIVNTRVSFSDKWSTTEKFIQIRHSVRSTWVYLSIVGYSDVFPRLGEQPPLYTW